MNPEDTSKKTPSRRERPEWVLIRSTLLDYLNNPKKSANSHSQLESTVEDPEIRRALDVTIHSRDYSYRDVALIQAAFAILNPGLDTRIRPVGARTLGSKVGRFLAEHFIPGVADAYQNIGKNTAALVRGSDEASDTLLTWMATASQSQVEACFHYACAEIAAMARPIRPMPTLDVPKLTFATMKRVYLRLLSIPSQGAYEQYSVASLLDALVEQTGISGYRVQTKKLNASDKSSRAAGDVELCQGNRPIEAYEVTANDWQEKLHGAIQKMAEHDLRRIHIVAPVVEREKPSIAEVLAGFGDDVSVISIHDFLDILVHSLTKTFRNHALIRLHEFLRRYQEDVSRVNTYSDILEAHGLTLSSGK